jgi:hypothetical protein
MVLPNLERDGPDDASITLAPSRSHGWQTRRGFGVTGVKEVNGPMPRTGDRNQVAGIYESTCGNRERITMPYGHEFPPCPTCRRAVYWRLVVATK